MGWFGSDEAAPTRSDISHDLSAPSGFDSDFGSSRIGSSSGGASGGAEDLQAFVQQQEMQAKLQEGLFKLNDVCWKMCVGSVDSRLSGKQETCITNCVGRFIDTSMFMNQRFAQLLQSQTRQ